MSLLGADCDLDPVFRDITLACHAPGALYSDPRLLEAEVREIFHKDWFCVARSEELPDVGDYFAFRIVKEPVLLCRDRAGAIRAYANMCRHRGVEIATGKGRASQFVCPYHGWTYDLDGRLKGAGYMSDSQGFDRAQCRLPELKVGLWGGWIFTTLNPDPQPFAEYLADFEEKFAYLALETLRVGLRIDVTLKCNWKLMVENFIDFYHVNVLHRDTIARFMKTVDLAYDLRRNGQVYVDEYDTGTLSKSGDLTATRIAALEGKSPRFSQAALLPPNMNFFVRPDYISVYTSWPLTVDSMRMSGVILWSRDTVEGPNRDRVVGEFKHMLDKVMAEDFSMVESLQNTAVSSGFCPGRMSRLERGVQHFIKHSLNRVLGERTAVHGAVEGRERGARAMSAAVLQYPLDAGGATVRVVQHGSAGPLVLFLHGLGSHADAWSQVAPALGAEGRRCLAVDLPGHGLSSKGPGFDYTLDGHVRWLAALIEALGEPQVHVVASSLGGLWAAGFAMRFPQRISSLTLIGALGLATLTAERRRWTAQYLREMDRESIADRLRRAVAEPAVIDENFIEQTFRMNNSPGAGEAFAALGRYYLERINDDMQLEPLIAVARSWPLLLIWGREDATVPYADAAAAAKRIPGCALFALDRTRHVPQLERPELVRGILSRQLRGEPLPAGPIEGGEIVSSTLDHTAAR